MLRKEEGLLKGENLPPGFGPKKAGVGPVFGVALLANQRRAMEEIGNSVSATQNHMRGKQPKKERTTHKMSPKPERMRGLGEYAEEASGEKVERRKDVPQMVVGEMPMMKGIRLRPASKCNAPN